jgi:PKD repeat protein
VTFTRDTEAPVIALSPAAALGFNPSDAEIAAAFGSASLSDNCSAGLVASGVTQPEQGTGCTRSVTKLWTVTDAAGNIGTASQTVTFTRDTEAPVIALSPAAALGFNPSDAEIAAAFGSASVSDNCGVGLVASGVIQAEQAIGCTRTVTKFWSVTDAAGNTGTASQTISFIRDTQAPRILSVTGPSAPIALGNAATIIASFADDCSGVLSVNFDWMDGSLSPLSEPTGQGPVSHIYSKPGIYGVRISVMDKSGNKAEDVLQFIVVYDANAGGVNGGGWIESKAGSYVSSPSLSGRANFGFVAKYKPGASIPSGQTEFSFGKLKFHSDSYEWLLVEEEGAQLKGSASVNGVSGYTFLLTITDGHCRNQKDKFRLKIWDAGGTVYDNVPGASDDISAASLQDIGQGSISIHR